MARTKMEKEFRQKLNEREITPTAAAWDRLDAMLTTAESQKSRKPFGWLYIAASLLGFLLVGSLFFNRDAARTVPESIVTQAAHEGAAEPADTAIPRQTQSGIASKDHEVPSAVAGVTQVKALSVHKKEQIAHVSIINHNQTLPGKPETVQQAATPGASSVNAIQDANADELLAAAQSRIDKESAKVKVNARSLLSEVDSEEHLTLRQKALRALNKNYQQVRVALETRNLEENH